MSHTFFENVRVTPIVSAAGTLVNTTADGTTAGTISASDYEYHALVYAGTIANTGTIFIFALGASQTNKVIGSVEVGSSSLCAIYEVKSDVLTSLGTLYTHLGANIAVDASGTWRGGAAWYSHQPRSAGTTPSALGWGIVGTALT